MKTSLKALIAKLNPLTRRAMESAVNVAHSRTHHEADVEHVLVELVGMPDSDCVGILKAYGIAPSKLEQDLLSALARMKTGNTRTPVLSVNIPRWLESAWLLASVDHNVTGLRSGFLLEALVVDEDLRRSLGSSCDLLGRIPADDLKKEIPHILRASKEAAESPTAPSQQTEAETTGLSASTPMPALDRYTSDLTQLARAGKLDPVLGRDGEIRQMIDILLRRRQNNPILTGEPGVGKTAVVEGLAARIVKGDVPDPLKNVALRALDLGLLQAGASVKGEFESRLRSVIDEVKASLAPIILFIDEAHTMIGAGGQSGQNDAANLLKPALARGELRTIAATTWSEYKKYFEKDAALARRFQVVKIEEPSEESAIQMLRGIAVAMEAHHQVRILDEAAVDAVKLSSRYLSGRQLPDKAVSVLDTACARVALSQASTPAPVEDLTRLIENIDREVAALRKEPEDSRHLARLEELKVRRAELEHDLAIHAEEQASQAALVQEVRKLRGGIAGATGEGSTSDAASTAKLQARLRASQAKLREAHKKQPLIYECVDSSTVAEVISGWTGIPLGRMVADEIDTVRNLKPLLESRIIGQPHALDLIVRHIQIARASLEDPGKPKGVFLLVGPSGVGKTETALALVDVLYGGERNLISINMSEYQEAHTVSGLKGSPPGYVGYGEGGVLTEAVRRKPYSVVLLDEVEKAHPDVLELFYQVFDKGLMEDAEGREIDFRNTIIILTSNIASDLVLRAVQHGVTVDGKSRKPSAEDLLELLRAPLQKAFKPAFLGRLSVVPYFPVQDDVLKAIIRLKLERLRGRIQANHGAEMTFDDALVDVLAERCTEVESGARNADAIISHLVLAELSDRLLEKLATGVKIKAIAVKQKKGKVQIQIKDQSNL